MTSDDDTASETHHNIERNMSKQMTPLSQPTQTDVFSKFTSPIAFHWWFYKHVSIYGRMGYVKKPAFIANCSEICFHVIHARSFHWCHYLDVLLYCCRFRVLLQSFFFEFMRCSNFNRSSHLRKTRHKCVLVVIVAMHSVVFFTNVEVYSSTSWCYIDFSAHAKCTVCPDR